MNGLRTWYRRVVSPFTRIWLRELRTPSHWGYHISTALAEKFIEEQIQAEQDDPLLADWVKVTRRGMYQQLIN